MADAVQLTLDDLLDTLGIDSLQALDPVASSQVVVTAIAIADLGSLEHEAPGALLLLPGVTADDPTAITILRRAAEAGAAAVVIRAGNAEDALHHAPLPVLRIADGLAWGDLYEMVIAVFSTRDRTVASARSESTTSPLLAFADAAALALGGAVSLEDAQGRVLAYSSIEGQGIDREREEVILARRVPLTRRNRAEYLALSRSLQPVGFDATGEDLARRATAVRAGGAILGFLWVIVDDPPPDLDERLADAAYLAALALRRARTRDAVSARRHDEGLRRLLDGAADPETIQRLGIPRETGAGVIAVRPAGRDQPAPDWLCDLVALVARVSFHHVRCTEIDGVAYAVVYTTPARLDELPAVAEAVRTRTRARLAVQVAVDTVRDAANVGQARRTADRVLVALSARGEQSATATYADVRSLAVLSELAEIVVARSPRLLQGGIGDATRPDADLPMWAQTTMRAYFDAAGNVHAAAALIGVHPNTVRYRLTRLSELLKLDFAEPDDRLVAALQLRLTELAACPTWNPGAR